MLDLKSLQGRIFMAELTVEGAPRLIAPVTAMRTVVAASCASTAFEWYDFFVFGTLVQVISKNFFAELGATAGMIAALALFGFGLAFRPVGALIFGRVGDLLGRKAAFLITVTMMGGGTFAIGLLPTYAQAGIVAPILLIALRAVQGLALGGQYGGAAIYVAEHARAERRGFTTGFVQCSASLGLIAALTVIYITRTSTGEAAFGDWAWRIPFFASAGLLAISIWMRMRLSESPAFQKLKDDGLQTKAPFTEAFGNWPNLKLVLIAFFCLMSAQGAYWYTVFFYSQVFMEKFAKLDGAYSQLLIMAAAAASAPCYVFFGWLSDKVGRKPIILAGCLLAVVTYFPLFQALTNAVNPQLEQALEKSPVVVTADPGECSFQFNPTGTASFTSSCDIAKSFLARNAVNYSNVPAPPGTPATIKIGDKVITSFDKVAAGAEGAAKEKAFNDQATAAIRAAGYPAAADRAKVNMPMVILILTILVLYVTMVYGPIAAMLVELFPTRIRYSGMSLPYHIGNGWFGGFLPPTAFAIVAATGNIYSGLWYPIVIAGMTFVIGLLFMPETKDRNIYVDD
jgi:MFS family permease